MRKCTACGAVVGVRPIVSVSAKVTAEERKALADAGYVVVSSERSFPSIKVEYPTGGPDDGQ